MIYNKSLSVNIHIFQGRYRCLYIERNRNKCGQQVPLRQHMSKRSQLPFIPLRRKTVEPLWRKRFEPLRREIVEPLRRETVNPMLNLNVNLLTLNSFNTMKQLKLKLTYDTHFNAKTKSMTYKYMTPKIVHNTKRVVHVDIQPQFKQIISGLIMENSFM